jgi:protein subunit release factor B
MIEPGEAITSAINTPLVEKEKATVPETYPTDRESLERDSTIEYYIASGPGGQHRNKVATGVRLTHQPSGTVVTATERRSQRLNREAAFERLAARLEAQQQVRAPRKSTRPSKANREERLETKRHTSAIKRLRSLLPEGES